MRRHVGLRHETGAAKIVREHHRGGDQITITVESDHVETAIKLSLRDLLITLDVQESDLPGNEKEES